MKANKYDYKYIQQKQGILCKKFEKYGIQL